jgi:GNAT superfamily N-acetyltransferase
MGKPIDSENYRVVRVNSRSALKAFINFPHVLYRKDPYYVPELYLSQLALLNPKTSPFYRHASVQLFLLYNREGKISGRVSAAVNHNYADQAPNKTGFFGFFETIQDTQAAKALLDVVCNTLREYGCTRVIGPLNFSTNETCGLLVENFFRPPYLLTTYNPPYYQGLLECYGFQKYTDLLSYEFNPAGDTPNGFQGAEELEKRLQGRGYTLRKLRMHDFQAEVDRFLHLYNEAWEANLGFVPMTEAEIRQIGQELRFILNPDFVFFAEKEGQAIGIALAVPNLNEVLIRVKCGRLLPFGLFRILQGKRKIKSLRIVALGILPPYRRTGLDFLLAAHLYRAATKKNITQAEASWILENNDLMNRAIARVGGRVYRKHRLYTMPVDHYLGIIPTQSS